MKDLAQYVICSNRWFSAVTEYAFQLAHYLKNEGYFVQVCAHDHSPLFSKAKESNLRCFAMPLQHKRIGEWLKSVLAVFVFLWTLPQNSKSVIWVVEGHEHTLCAVFSFCFPRIRNRILLVRLRGQDRFRKLGLIDRFVFKATDFIVFPSWYAAKKLFGEKFSDQISSENIFVQPFSKNFNLDSRSLDFEQRAVKLESFLESKLIGIDFFSRLTKLNFVSVARFDKVKGLESLIADFALANFGSHCARLFLIGRSEALSAKYLANLAYGSLGEKARLCSKTGCLFIENSKSTKQIFIFEEYFSDLVEFISCCQFAVISSLGSEIICRTAVEYLQVSLPVISTPVGSLKETLGSCAAIYADEIDHGSEAHSAYSFVKSFERAAEICSSMQLYVQMSEAAQIQGKKYRRENFSGLFQKVMEKLAS